MTVTDTIPERRYALTRVEAGDYLCPSNDGAYLWRFSRYEEDGSAEYGDGSPLVGEFWMAQRTPMPKSGHIHLDDLGGYDWSERQSLLPRRADAIEAMLRDV